MCSTCINFKWSVQHRFKDTATKKSLSLHSGFGKVIAFYQSFNFHLCIFTNMKMELHACTYTQVVHMNIGEEVIV